MLNLTTENIIFATNQKCKHLHHTHTSSILQNHVTNVLTSRSMPAEQLPCTIII